MPRACLQSSGRLSSLLLHSTASPLLDCSGYNNRVWRVARSMQAYISWRRARPAQPAGPSVQEIGIERPLQLISAHVGTKVTIGGGTRITQICRRQGHHTPAGAGQAAPPGIMQSRGFVPRTSRRKQGKPHLSQGRGHAPPPRHGERDKTVRRGTWETKERRSEPAAGKNTPAVSSEEQAPPGGRPARRPHAARTVERGQPN